MTLKHLDSIEIINGEEFSVIPEATHYKIKDGRVLQFGVNPEPTRYMHEIPKGAMTFRVIGFERRFNRFGRQIYIDYGKLEFYSVHGNILKVDNR